tara:strand:- start:262 stop:660 length:399 start_codon:yes stop_codon:yes gene_type:complete
MTLRSTFTSNPVKTIIVNQDAATNSSGVGDNNVAGGSAYLISVKIANASNGNATYLKFYDSASATAGTDTARMVLMAPANGTKTYNFHPPIYFSNAVTVVATATSGQAGTTVPNANTNSLPSYTLILSSSAS